MHPGLASVPTRSVPRAICQGEVYDARDHGQWRDVAFRVLRTDFVANPERLRRFEQDTRAAAALIHPNILTVHNIGTDAAAAYIVSEPLRGATLRESLNRGVLPSLGVALLLLSVTQASPAQGQETARPIALAVQASEAPTIDGVLDDRVLAERYAADRFRPGGAVRGAARV